MESLLRIALRQQKFVLLEIFEFGKWYLIYFRLRIFLFLSFSISWPILNYAFTSGCTIFNWSIRIRKCKNWARFLKTGNFLRIWVFSFKFIIFFIYWVIAILVLTKLFRYHLIKLVLRQISSFIQSIKI